MTEYLWGICLHCKAEIVCDNKDSSSWEHYYIGETSTDTRHCRISVASPATDTAPECEGHNESQRRDGLGPWCSRCGWTHGQPTIEAAKIGTSTAEREGTHRPWSEKGGYQ